MKAWSIIGIFIVAGIFFGILYQVGADPEPLGYKLQLRQVDTFNEYNNITSYQVFKYARIGEEVKPALEEHYELAMQQFYLVRKVEYCYDVHGNKKVERHYLAKRPFDRSPDIGTIDNVADIIYTYDYETIYRRTSDDPHSICTGGEKRDNLRGWQEEFQYLYNAKLQRVVERTLNNEEIKTTTDYYYFPENRLYQSEYFIRNPGDNQARLHEARLFLYSGLDRLTSIWVFDGDLYPKKAIEIEYNHYGLKDRELTYDFSVRIEDFSGNWQR
jgi:hypothetical protein